MGPSRPDEEMSKNAESVEKSNSSPNLRDRAKEIPGIPRKNKEKQGKARKNMDFCKILNFIFSWFLPVHQVPEPVRKLRETYRKNVHQVASKSAWFCTSYVQKTQKVND